MNSEANNPPLRLDKWLWYARFFKTRTAATKAILGGRFRVDGRIISKPHHSASCGQVLTFPGAKEVRVIRIDALGTRRGPASEAALLYTDLEVPMRVKAKKVSEGALDFETRAPGCGRPTKLQRRKTDRLKRRFL